MDIVILLDVLFALSSLKLIRSTKYVYTQIIAIYYNLLFWNDMRKYLTGKKSTPFIYLK
jgi:hypothetical protein